MPTPPPPDDRGLWVSVGIVLGAFALGIGLLLGKWLGGM